jgi:hypothetical protein
MACFNSSSGNDSGKDTMVSGWIPQNCDVDNMLCRLSSTTDEIKEFYNNNYDKICGFACPEELLKQAIKINGFYLDSVNNDPSPLFLMPLMPLMPQ